MSDYKQIHETVIRDIIDLMSDAKEVYNNGDLSKFKPFSSDVNSMRSLTRATSDLVLVFPFMCDSTVSIATANLMSKAIERNATSMLEMLFASCSLVKDGDDVTNGFEFIRKFHKNINVGSKTVDDVIGGTEMRIDDFIKGMKECVEEGYVKVDDQVSYDAVMKDMEGLDFTLPDSLRESSLSNFSVLERYGSPIVLKESNDDDYDKNDPFRNKDLHNPEKLSKFYKDMADFQKTRILDSDVKKANEVAPTMMVVNFFVEGREKAVSFVCGVKCRLIPVDPYDIANHIMVKNADRNVLLSFVRASTKEISFFKDFLFAIDKAKVDAMSKSRRGSSNQMWKVLERRAVKSRWKRAMSRPNDASSITTLGMSKDLVEYIKKNNGIDVEAPRVMEPIMEGFNLMGTVIIDEADEVASFMWDTGEGMYEQISFNNIERETNGGEYKKAINLVSKMYH